MTSGRLGLNDAPREGGKFFWQQLWNVKHLGARTVYVAMFDEYDEGTAILPSVPLKRSLPKTADPQRPFQFIALDADGVDNLTPDWYLRICGFASEAMKDERRVYEELPKKELDDYWANRPRYENTGSAAYSSGSRPSEVGSTGQGSGSGSSAGAGSGSSAAPTAAVGASSGGASTGVRPPVRQNTGAWGGIMDEKDEAAPPPYTLEALSDPVETTTTTTSNAAASSGAPASSPIRNNEAENTSTRPGAPTPHRASSYSAPPTAPPTQNQGATGLGRATSYSPASVSSSSGIPTVSITSGTPSNSSTPVTNANQTRPSFAPPTFAPPSSAPPGGLGSSVSSNSSLVGPSSSSNLSQQLPATQSPLRPPIHPASPLAGPTNVSRPTSGASTPISHQSYSPHQAPGSLPINSSPTSNLAQNFSTSMSLGPGPALGPGSSGSSSSAPHSPLGQPQSTYTSQQPSSTQPQHGSQNAYTNIQGPGGFAPGRPTGAWVPPSGSPNQSPYGSTGPNTSNSGYFPSTNATATGVISNPAWGAPTSGPPPHRPQHANSLPMPGMPGLQPNSHSPSPVPPSGFVAPGFAPPGHAPTSTATQPATAFSGVGMQPLPTSTSNPSSPHGWTASFPGQDPTAAGTGVGTGSGINAPPLPPRPSGYPGDPGNPGGFVAPQRTCLSRLS